MKNKKTGLINMFIGFIVLTLLTINTTSAIYDDISIQGKLTNSTNSSAMTGDFAFSFNLYNVITGGSSLYESNQTLITDSDGIYNAVLESIDLKFDVDYYVGINVNDTGEMSPRIQIRDSGNAMRSNETEHFNNHESSYFLNTSTSFEGDVSGSYNSISLDADSVSDNEIDYSTVTLVDFTNDASFVTTSDDSVSSSELDNICNTNDRILIRSAGTWGCFDYSVWTTDSELTTANTSMKNYVDAQDIVYNNSMKTYVDALDSSQILDHNGHTIHDTFVHIINRGKVNETIVSLDGGLDVSWSSTELYDGATDTFFITDAGSGTLTDNVPNYLKWVSGDILTLSTSTSSDDEILVERFSVYDGIINGYRNVTIISESVGNTRRGVRIAFPTIIKSGLLVNEDTNVTNSLDVTMSSGVLIKDLIETKYPSQINSRTTELVRHFHSGGSWSHDTNIEINTTHYDDGSDLVVIPSNKWVKAYFIYMNGKIGFVYPTECFTNEASALEASLPSIPPGLDPVPRLTAIVYQQGDTDFTSTTWQDIRPSLTTESFNIVTDHGSLVGLSDDDHPQYLELDGTDELSDNWDVGQHDIIARSFNSSVWTNVSITESQVSDADWWDADADLNEDEISESKILFSTVCAAGNHYYLNGNDLACESDDDTTYTAGLGLTLTTTTFAHNDTSSQSSSDNSARTYIQDIILDTYGHITSIVTATETVTDTNTNANTECSGTTTYYDGEGNCDDISSVYQPLETTLTDIADGTINENLVNTVNPWADDEVSNTLTCSDLVSASAVVDISTESNLVVGNGITLTDDTLTVVGGTAITADAGGLSITADAIGDTQLEYNTGQHLATTNSPTFQNVTVEEIKFENDATNHRIYDNTTCIIIKGDTSTWNIC